VYGAPTHQVVLHPTTLAAAGDGVGHNNMQPFAVVNYCIALSGIYPTRE
jgi:microcystin-dependent protein